MIPTYRAKKIDSDEWVEGFYIGIDNDLDPINAIVESCTYYEISIDPNTLSIHFQNMIDKNDKKIFASLSEDGVGGDIITYDKKFWAGGKLFETQHRKQIVTHSSGWCDYECEFHIGVDLPRETTELEVIGIHKG